MLSHFDNGKVVHRSVNACLCPLYAVEGMHVVTVEGESELKVIETESPLTSATVDAQASATCGRGCIRCKRYCPRATARSAASARPAS